MPETDDTATIAIHLPRWMLDDLREVAGQRGCTVTEHIRRCVALDRTLFSDPAAEVVLLLPNGQKRTIRLRDITDA